MKVGFIGLGLMGRPMALHLEKAGHELHLWARRPESLAPFAAVNAKTHASPAEVAQQAEVVIVMVADAPDVEKVCLGADGLAAGARPDWWWSTCRPSTPMPRAASASAWRKRASSSSMHRCPAARPGRSTRR
jgi:2-hydroxy-3-oxopropionate reductase